MESDINLVRRKGGGKGRRRGNITFLPLHCPDDQLFHRVSVPELIVNVHSETPAIGRQREEYSITGYSYSLYKQCFPQRGGKGGGGGGGGGCNTLFFPGTPLLSRCTHQKTVYSQWNVCRYNAQTNSLKVVQIPPSFKSWGNTVQVNKTPKKIPIYYTAVLIMIEMQLGANL